MTCNLCPFREHQQANFPTERATTSVNVVNFYGGGTTAGDDITATYIFTYSFFPVADCCSITLPDRSPAIPARCQVCPLSPRVGSMLIQLSQTPRQYDLGHAPATGRRFAAAACRMHTSHNARMSHDPDANSCHDISSCCCCCAHTVFCRRRLTHLPQYLDSSTVHRVFGAVECIQTDALRPR